MYIHIRILHERIFLCAPKVVELYGNGFLLRNSLVNCATVFLFVFPDVFFGRACIVAPSHIQINAIETSFHIEANSNRRRELEPCG